MAVRYRNVAGHELVFGLDTGNKACLTLESSVADPLPLRGVPEELGELRTHHNSYPFHRAYLDGAFDLAGHTIESVELQLSRGLR